MPGVSGCGGYLERGLGRGCLCARVECLFLLYSFSVSRFSFPRRRHFLHTNALSLPRKLTSYLLVHPSSCLLSSRIRHSQSRCLAIASVVCMSRLSRKSSFIIPALGYSLRCTCSCRIVCNSAIYRQSSLSPISDDQYRVNWIS